MSRTQVRTLSRALGGALIVLAGGTFALATEPCGDLGECKALIEINATDGDIGFHFLMDGDDLNSARITDPFGAKVFEEKAKGSLRDQKLTETFSESAEPLCWSNPEADPDEEVVTLEEFLDRWPAGLYTFIGHADEGEETSGSTEFTHALPAAPAALAFDGSVVTWAAGTDLGHCGTHGELDELVADGVLPVHPEEVPVAAWEITLEPDREGSPTGKLTFSLRVAGDIAVKAVEVPAEYLASLPDDTPVKIEIGAIGADDNATFTEVHGFCVNEVKGCED